MLKIQRDTPEAVGIPSACIRNFTDRLTRQGIPMHSLLIMRHDRLAVEAYYAPFQKDDLHRMFSISKSFTSVAIGLLAEEGKLSLDDKIIRYFPEYLPDSIHPFLADMTIRDMLMMRTCYAKTTYNKNDLKSNWVESYFTASPTHPAGTLFHYDTSAAHTLCALCEKLTGLSMLDYLKKKLAPLGLSERAYLLKDPCGVSLGGSGLVATSMDLLKFGYFIFHKGSIEGKQLLSEAYLTLATSHLTDTCITAPLPSEAMGYGMQFWCNERGGYVCYGMGGQLIIFLPKEDMICVTTADTQGIGGGNQRIYDALYEEILPCLSDVPLPLPLQTASAYQKLLNTLSLPLTKGMKTSPLMDAVNGKVFSTCSGIPGYERVSLSFGDCSAPSKLSGDTGLKPPAADSAAFSAASCMTKKAGSPKTAGKLCFTYHGVPYFITFGLGFFLTGELPIYHFRYAAEGVWLTDGTLSIRLHIIDSSVGSIRFQLRFLEDSLLIYMRKIEETLLQEFDGHLYCTT